MSFMQMLTQPDKSRLVVIPFRSGEENPLGVEYRSRGDEAPQPQIIGVEALEKHTRHVIDHAAETFEPRLLEINGRQNRRSCVVVSGDGQQIRIYDLDAVGSS